MWGNQPGLTTADLAGVRVPTLILIGDHDLVTREHAEQMHAAITASLLIIRMAGACPLFHAEETHAVHLTGTV